MWLFLDYVSYAFHKIDEKDACIIVGAIFGFFIQLIAVLLWDSHSNSAKRK